MGNGAPILQEIQEYRQKLKENNYLSWKINCFVEITEKEGTRYKDRMEGFIIGSIREPCDQYVSLFTYASGHHGGVWHQATKHKRLANLIGEDGPMFNSSSDVEKFHGFLKHRAVFGRVHKQLNRNYKDGKELEVDCWVFVDDFQVSLYQCLRQYEAQGGYLDWNSSLAISLMNEAKEILSHRGLKEHKHSEIKDKNDVIGNPQELHHAPCETYFNEESMKMVEDKDSIVYEIFGYEGCCKGRRMNYGLDYFNDTMKSKHIIANTTLHEAKINIIPEKTLHLTGPILLLLILYVTANIMKKQQNKKNEKHEYNHLRLL